jgi:hypothetical protein
MESMIEANLDSGVVSRSSIITKLLDEAVVVFVTLDWAAEGLGSEVVE